jgi:hypothetical protein
LLICEEDHISTAASIAAIRSTERDTLFSPKTYSTSTTIT